MSSVKIHLDNYNNKCYPGQTITGRVECYFNKKKNVRAIRINISGIAQTEWRDRASYYDEEKKKQVTGNTRLYAEEKYFDEQYTLFQGGDKYKLAAGTYTYPFSYVLPSQIPSPYEGRFGKIRYCLKAVVHLPWNSVYEDDFNLNIVSPLDLNTFPGLSNPIAISADKSVCTCWCTRSGRLTFYMTLAASGFVPGQEVSVSSRIINTTNINVECISFKIIGNIKFISHYPVRKSKYEKITIAECKENGVGANHDKSWTTSIQISTNQFCPNFTACGIINVLFRLKAVVVLPTPHTNLECDVPITLGTIPLSGINIPFTSAPLPEIGFQPSLTQPLNEGSFIVPPYSAENTSNTYPVSGGLKVPMHEFPTTSAPSAPACQETSFNSFTGSEMNMAPPSYDEIDQ